MLKHASQRISPLRSSDSSSHHLNSIPSGNHFSTNHLIDTLAASSTNFYGDTTTHFEGNSNIDPQRFSEREVDCEGLVPSTVEFSRKDLKPDHFGLGSFIGGKILTLSSLSGSENVVKPVITYGRAIVRRGLSFNAKTPPDSLSMRSVRSDTRERIFNKPNKDQGTFPQSYSLMVLPSNNDGTTRTNESRIDVLRSSNKEEMTHSKKEKELNSSYFDRKQMAMENKQMDVVPQNQKLFVVSQSNHPIIKSLLQLPGVFNHIPVPESTPQDTPHLLSPDSLSLNYPDSFVTTNSGRTSSRSWCSSASSNTNNTNNSSTSNCSSTSEPASTMLKIFTNCLRSNIEYKTVNIGSKVTCRQLIAMLLTKMRMKHRDPNLFYVTMEVTVKRWSGGPERVLLVLEDSARPAQLALCRPSGDLKFVLQMRRGGVIKISDTVLTPGSQYKSLILSQRTTSEEAVQLLLNCYGRGENKIYYALHEVCHAPQYSDRRLGSSEKPLEVKAQWSKHKRADYSFVLRRNMSQALSLRKLSLRTFATTDVDERQDFDLQSRLSSNRPQTASKELKCEQTMIDCTSTTPVMKMFSTKEVKPSFSTKNKNKRGSPHEILPGREMEVVCAMPAVANDKNDQDSRNVQTEQKREFSFIPNISKQPNLRSNSNSLVQSGRLANGLKNFKQPLEYDHDKDYFNRKSLSEISKQNPQYYLLDTRFPTSTRIISKSRNEVHPPGKGSNLKVVMSSAVQTELTCIPVKGPRIKYRWNSVETLIPPKYSSYTRNEINEKARSQTTSPETHNGGRQCQCEKCFYI